VKAIVATMVIYSTGSRVYKHKKKKKKRNNNNNNNYRLVVSVVKQEPSLL
jgi:hypothetical protein